MTAKAQWGIHVRHSDENDWEEERLARVRSMPPSASDNDHEPRVLLVDHRDRPLLVTEPRPVGFRKP